MLAIFVLPMQHVAQKWILHFSFWSLSKATSGWQIRNCDVMLVLMQIITLHDEHDFSAPNLAIVKSVNAI